MTKKNQPSDNKNRDKHPNEIAGSAIGAKVSYEVDLASKLRTKVNDLTSMADEFKAGDDVDTVNSTKFPTPGNVIKYLMGGIISSSPGEGKFKFSKDSLKSTPGGLQINEAKSEFLSTSQQTKLGSTEIKTMTGSQVNAGGLKQASSSMTPQKAWIKSLFPAFANLNVANFIVLKVAMNLLKDIDTERTVTNTRKDLGTIIIDNQDFELAILNGSI